MASLFSSMVTIAFAEFRLRKPWLPGLISAENMA
jgi:hypothetical protein